jgi:hypothetical protein
VNSTCDHPDRARPELPDWTGVAPDLSPIAPLDADNFVARLQRLSERAESLTILRRAFADPNVAAKIPGSIAGAAKR